MRKVKGFTLIELLIVVAIIAILAAIAVPNFLEAQIRSKVSRVKADHRTLATAIESYYIDHNAYPPNNNGISGGDPSALPQADEYMISLSTPIGYVAVALLSDPFQKNNVNAPSSTAGDYGYLNGSGQDTLANIVITAALGLGTKTANSIKANQWWVGSAGPDNVTRQAEIAFLLGVDPYNVTPGIFVVLLNEIGSNPTIYDPSNGTISPGDILRTAKGIFEPKFAGF
jgi:type II secretion system protein G